MKKLLILLTLGLMFGQTKLETRVYSDISISRFETFDIYNITGYNFDYFILEIINVFIHTDLPVPVAPATNRCGIFDKSNT